MQNVPMTAKGAEALETELEHLTRVERRRISQSIAEARAHGDLKENAEYHAAKEEQGFCEARIRTIEARLLDAQVVDVKTLVGLEKIVFGATVQLLNLKTEEELYYQIVGEDEADIKQGKISITSPMARPLIGKVVGDAIEVNAPSGSVEYEILDIEYK